MSIGSPKRYEVQLTKGELFALQTVLGEVAEGLYPVGGPLGHFVYKRFAKSHKKNIDRTLQRHKIDDEVVAAEIKMFPNALGAAILRTTIDTAIDYHASNGIQDETQVSRLEGLNILRGLSFALAKEE